MPVDYISNIDNGGPRSKLSTHLSWNYSLSLKCLIIFLILFSLVLSVIVIGLSITIASLYRALTTVPSEPPTGTSTTTVIPPMTELFSSTSTMPLPFNATCGMQAIPPKLLLPRIYAGTEAVPNSWPWIVFYIESMRCNESTCPSNICGGTLIDARFVLTAAHCITSNNSSSIRIIAGLHNISSTVERNFRQNRQVEKVFIYPGFDHLAPLNDIAIIQLAAPFYLNKYVQLACLSSEQPDVNETVMIAGWGSEEYRGRHSPILRQAPTQVIGDCNRWWASEGVDDRRQICVASNITGVSACNGDSGGPLLFKAHDRWFVGGIASYVEKFNCKTNNSRPNVYTRVSFYLPWINQIIRSTTI